ncbi:MAG TPA: NAD(P)/FAD-dependent oxidoreductase [Dehalococcoidia bacterium]|nr:NAD(P)/FAD-dependent oxidoreductase [Dehalococcoidia bacterium]
MYDVAIVGGGPSGSYVAYKLAAMGYAVVVLEQKEKLGERVCCTGIISQECVESFAIDNNVILRQVNSARFFSPSGRLLRLWRQESQACIVDRAAFDVAVANRAQGKGAEYVLNCSVKDIESKDDRVNIEAILFGERLDFESRVVVIATGFGSKLSEGLGLGKASDFVIGTQAQVETIGVDEVEVFFGQEIAPGFFAWLVPISQSKALVGLLSRRSPGLYLKKLLSALLAEGKIASTEAELIYGGIPLKPLARTCSQRLIVVGDAAGQVKPTTGGGIYYGLLCADIAANTLHRALENDNLSIKGLVSYERQWRRKLGQELKIDYYARKFFERLSDRHTDRIFDIIESNGIDKALLKAEDLSFDWHGEAVLRLMGHRALSKALKTMKIPFHLGERG